MSKKELYIKQNIDKNNQIIASILNPGQFVLNNTIAELLNENKQLQEQCDHEFVDGYCIYCYMEDPNRKLEDIE